jgi:hypothetical protein
VGDLRCIGILDNYIGLFKAFLDVSLAPLEIRDHIADAVERNRQPFVRQQIRVQHRRIRAYRGYRIEQRFDLFVFDLDQFEGLLGGQSRFRSHCRNFLADKPHHAIRQNRRVVNASADPQPRYVLPGDHRLHTRHLGRFAGIDSSNAAIRNRAAQTPAP